MTIVYDNYQYDPDLRTIWGFSCLAAFLGRNPQVTGFVPQLFPSSFK